MLRDLRNRFDFFVRSRIRWGRAVDAEATLERDAPYQAEFASFLKLFDWRAALAPLAGRAKLTVADVGCRTFLYAPLFERHFKEHGFAVTLHGIELDAYRRFTDLRTRKDYGRFYAARVADGHYHAVDVRTFREPLDVAFLLHPFVSKEPLLRWGLPTCTLAPRAIFEHVYELLRPQNGILITSNPTEEELAITKSLAADVGFRAAETRTWRAPNESESTDRLSVRWSCGARSDRDP